MQNYDTLLLTYNKLREDTISEIERVAHALGRQIFILNYPFVTNDPQPGGGNTGELTINTINVTNKKISGIKNNKKGWQLSFEETDIKDLLHILNCIDGNAYKGATKKPLEK